MSLRSTDCVVPKPLRGRSLKREVPADGYRPPCCRRSRTWGGEHIHQAIGVQRLEQRHARDRLVQTADDFELWRIDYPSSCRWLSYRLWRNREYTAAQGVVHTDALQIFARAPAAPCGRHRNPVSCPGTLGDYHLYEDLFAAAVQLLDHLEQVGVIGCSGHQGIGGLVRGDGDLAARTAMPGSCRRRHQRRPRR